MVNNNNIKYVESTDYIQIYSGSEWINWILADLKTRYLYKSGNQYSDFTGGFIKSLNVENNYTLNFNNNGSIYLSLTNGTLCFNTVNFMDLSMYSRLEIICTYNITHQYSGNTLRMGLSAVENMDYVGSFFVYHEIAQSKNQTETISINLQNYSTQLKRCKFALYISESGTSNISINTIRLYQ